MLTKGLGFTHRQAIYTPSFGLHSSNVVSQSRETCEGPHRCSLRFSPPVWKSDLKRSSTSKPTSVSVGEPKLPGGVFFTMGPSPPALQLYFTGPRKANLTSGQRSTYTLVQKETEPIRFSKETWTWEIFLSGPASVCLVLSVGRKITEVTIFEAF